MRLPALCILALPACVGDTGDTTDDSNSGSAITCEALDTVAVVTDIDETLTTDDMEYVYQILDPDHDPEMRPDADTLMGGLHDLGYRMIYLTARGEELGLLDGTSARDATTGWLDTHGFPYADEDVYLATGLGETGDGAADYKTEVLTSLQDAGVTLALAYGNADTDIAAYQAAGIPDDHIFLVGDLAGDYGVEPIPTEDAYTSHMASYLPTVPCAAEAGG